MVVYKNWGGFTVVVVIKIGPWEFRTKNKLIIFINELVRRYNDNRIAYTSGSMAYFFTLSLFPFIMFLNALIGLVNLDNTTLVALISPFFPAQIVDLLVTYNDYIANISNNYVLIFSIIISLYSASRAVNAINITINTIYGIEQRRHPVSDFLLSTIFTLAVGILTLVLLAAIAVGSKLFEQLYIVHLTGQTITVLTITVISLAFIMIFFVLMFLYYFAPYRRMRLRRVVWGSLFSTVGIALIGVAISIYVRLSHRFSLLYGSIGAIIVVMLWFYIFGNIVSIGAEMNHLLEQMANTKKGVKK